jgi:hypothetical protein
MNPMPPFGAASASSMATLYAFRVASNSGRYSAAVVTLALNDIEVTYSRLPVE